MCFWFLAYFSFLHFMWICGQENTISNFCRGMGVYQAQAIFVCLSFVEPFPYLINCTFTHLNQKQILPIGGAAYISSLPSIPLLSGTRFLGSRFSPAIQFQIRIRLAHFQYSIHNAFWNTMSSLLFGEQSTTSSTRMFSIERLFMCVYWYPKYSPSYFC